MNNSCVFNSPTNATSTANSTNSSTENLQKDNSEKTNYTAIGVGVGAVVVVGLLIGVIIKMKASARIASSQSMMVNMSEIKITEFEEMHQVQGPTQSQTIDEFKKIERPKIINKQKK
jgi:beta-lactamase regulating signal transducer with metallopeptidase domain